MSEIPQTQVTVNEAELRLRYVPDTLLEDGGTAFAQEVYSEVSQKEPYQRPFYAKAEVFELPVGEVAFNPYVAEVILETLEQRSTPRLIEPSDREAAWNDIQAFATTVDRVLQKKPEKVVQIAEMALPLLGEESINNLIDRVIAEKTEVTGLAYNFEKVLRLFPEDSGQQKMLAQKVIHALSNEMHGEVLVALGKEGAVKSIGLEEATRIVKQTILKSSVVVSEICIMVEAGIITKEDAAKTLLERHSHKQADPNRSSDNAREIPAMFQTGVFTDPEDLNFLKNDFIRGFEEDENFDLMGNYLLNDLPEDFISREEVAAIVQHRFTMDPTFCVFNLEIALNYLPEQVVQARVAKMIASSSGLDTVSFLEKIFEHESILTPVEKTQLANKLIVEQPDVFMKRFDILINFIPEDERREAVDNLLATQQSFDRTCIYSMNEWMPYISKEPAEQKEFLVGIVKERGTLDLALLLGDSLYPPSDYPNLLTRQEIIDLVTERLPANIENITVQLSSIIAGFTRDEIREFADKMYEIDPSLVVQELGRIGYLYTNQEVGNIVEQLKSDTDIKSLMTLLRNVKEWSTFVEMDVVKEVVGNAADRMPETTLSYIGSVNSAVEGDMAYINSLFEQLATKNPAAVIRQFDFVKKYLDENITPESVADRGSLDTERIALAPVSLKKFYRRIKVTTDENQRAILTTEASAIYGLINTLERQGLSSLYNTVRSDPSYSNKLEREALDSFSTVAILKNRGLELELGKVEKLSDLKAVMLDAIVAGLGMDIALTPVERSRFFEAFNTGDTSFMVYAASQSGGNNNGLIQEMTAAVLSGEFEAWRTAKSLGLDEAKKQGLMPQATTPEQLDVWNHQTSLELSDGGVAASSEDVAKSVGEVLKAELTKIETTLDTQAPLDVQLIGLRAKMAEYGKEIAELNNSKRVDLEKGDSTTAAAKSDQIEEIKRKQQVTRRDIDIAVLLGLTADEIESGAVFDQKKGKTTEHIDRLIQRLQENLPEQASYIADDVRQLLIPNAPTNKVRVYETIDPTDTIEIGANPVGSCQHYAHGIFNQSLVAYTDPNTKIIMADKGDIHVGRAIVRFLNGEAGTAALYLEKSYFNDASPSIKESILEIVREKARLMGVPLYVKRADYSSVTGNDSNTLTPTTTILHSNGSRAASVYSDAAGGLQVGGHYSISGLVKVAT